MGGLEPIPADQLTNTPMYLHCRGKTPFIDSYMLEVSLLIGQALYYIIPGIVIAVFNSLIIVKIRHSVSAENIEMVKHIVKRKNRVKANKKAALNLTHENENDVVSTIPQPDVSAAATNQTASNIPTNRGDPAQPNTNILSQHNKRLTIMSLMVSGVFLLLMIPAFVIEIVIVFYGFTHGAPPYIYTVMYYTVGTLCSLNHTLNVALYCLATPSFRRDLVKLICSCYRTR
jgi:hypothetical protein